MGKNSKGARKALAEAYSGCAPLNLRDWSSGWQCCLCRAWMKTHEEKCICGHTRCQWELSHGHGS